MKSKQAYNQFSDSELIAFVKKGDSRAFDAVFLRYYPQVHRFMQALVKDDTLAEDLSQMVFMKVWLYRDRLDDVHWLPADETVISRLRDILPEGRGSVC